MGEAGNQGGAYKKPAQGDILFGKIFYRCEEPGSGPFGAVFSHGDHNLLAENNIFVECRRALASAAWSDELWAEALAGGLRCDWNRRLREEVDITQPPYATRYPRLVRFLDWQPGQPRVSRAVRNGMVRCGHLSNGN